MFKCSLGKETWLTNENGFSEYTTIENLADEFDTMDEALLAIDDARGQLGGLNNASVVEDFI